VVTSHLLPPFIIDHLKAENSSCESVRTDDGSSTFFLVCSTFCLNLVNTSASVNPPHLLGHLAGSGTCLLSLGLGAILETSVHNLEGSDYHFVNIYIFTLSAHELRLLKRIWACLVPRIAVW